MGDFLQFDSDKANIMDDANDLLSTYRTGGCVSGVAPSNTHNKLFYQISTFAAALAGALKAKGYTMSDAILADLQTEFGEIVTELDMVHSLLANGYQKLPKGPDGLQLIIQWGTGTSTSTGVTATTTAIVFPMTFPNGIFFVGGNSLDKANTVSGFWPVLSATSVTVAGATIILDILGGQGNTVLFNHSVPFNYLAIGY
jgi:hypothetical protein